MGPDIRLIPIDEPMGETVEAGADAFSRRYHADLGQHPELVRQVVSPGKSA